MVTGLVLQGGGALGAFELGVIESVARQRDVARRRVGGVDRGRQRRRAGGQQARGSAEGSPRAVGRPDHADAAAAARSRRGAAVALRQSGNVCPALRLPESPAMDQLLRDGTAPGDPRQVRRLRQAEAGSHSFAAADPHRHQPGLRRARSLRQPEDGGDGRARRRQRQPPARLPDDHRARPGARRGAKAVLGRRAVRQHATLQGHRRAGGITRRTTTRPCTWSTSSRRARRCRETCRR